MTLSDLSIKRPVFAWMLMAGLIVFGAICASRLGVTQMPNVDFPVLNVRVEWLGAAPEVMELEIVDKLEQVLISVRGVKEVSSTVRQGEANVLLEFEIDRDIDAALQETQTAISTVVLPRDVRPPTIFKFNPEDQPIIWIGVKGNTSLRDLMAFVDQKLRDSFQTIPGVGQVVLGGYTEQRLRVSVRNDDLRRHELTILDLKHALITQHIETSAGRLTNDTQEINLRFRGEGLSAEEVGNILISERGGQPIYNRSVRVRDVATVKDDVDDLRAISRVSGVLGVGMGIRKQEGANAVAVAKAVRAKMNDLLPTMPPEFSMEVSYDGTEFVKESVQETIFTLILSAIITSLVCFLFLGSWNSTVNVLMSIPTSILGTMIVLYFLDFTLNFFTLLGLALAIGIVVDDAIMVLENIVRHAAMGKNRRKAAQDGAREITFAALAATVAVIAIFLPVAFMRGIIGKFLYQFGITISAAVALSLVEAITLTPMRCSQFLDDPNHKNRLTTFMKNIFDGLSRRYGKALALAWAWKKTVVGVSLIFFFASLGLLKFIPGEFVPSQDQSMFLMTVKAATDASLEATNQKLLEVEKFIKSRPEFDKYYVAVGGFEGGQIDTGILFVTLKPKRERKMSQKAMMDLTREETKKIPGIEVFVQDLSMSSFSADNGFPVNFSIRGPQWEGLREYSAKIIEHIKAEKWMTDVDKDHRFGKPEVNVWPERDKAALRGVAISTLAETIQTAMGGAREGKFSSEGRRYDVLLEMDAKERAQATDLEKIQVRNIYGELVDLASVTRIETKESVPSFSRHNRERSISIFGNVASGQSQSDVLKKIEESAKSILPKGYHMVLKGSAEAFAESGREMMTLLILGIVLSYMVLAAQFNSFIHPLTVLLALPFSISGALVALLLGGQSLNLYSFIGIILLMGIVKKNSILLVEFANHEREHRGVDAKAAMLSAGPVRLRPIMMTSMATIAAAIPPALAIGPGAESRIPMAIATMGGVIVSTAFTLFVIPCAYGLLARFERKSSVEP